MAKSSSISSSASAASRSASSAASAASKSASAASRSASSAASSAASAASKTASTGAASASQSISSATDKVSQSLSSAASAASATATKLASDAEQGLGGLSTVSITIAVLVTLLAVVAAAIYFSGYADDLGKWGAKKYYVGKAEAEAKALGNMGGEKVEGFLKDSLKKNPVMGKDELDQVAPGLGKEAAKEGLAGVSDLAKL